LRANSRYLDALAVVDDPTNAERDLDRITTRKKDAAGRGCSAFNPLAHHDVELFRAVMDGEHCLRGFTNRDIRSKLQSTQHLRSIGQDRKKASSKVSRIFRRFHAHGLIAKIPRSRRWRVTHYLEESWAPLSIFANTTLLEPMPEVLHNFATSSL
jgi:hypothetical protein